MNDIWPDGGRVSWLQNDGSLDWTAWRRRYICKSPGMHRIKGVYLFWCRLLLTQTIFLAGHFTRKDRLQIIAVPIIVASGDLNTPIPIIICTAPENPLAAPVNDDTRGWEITIPFPNKFVLVHEVTGTLSFQRVLILFHDADPAQWYLSLEHATPSSWQEETESIRSGITSWRTAGSLPKLMTAYHGKGVGGLVS